MYSVWIVPIQQQLQRIESKFERLLSSGIVGQLKIESAADPIPKEGPHMKSKGPSSKRCPYPELVGKDQPHLKTKSQASECPPDIANETEDETETGNYYIVHLSYLFQLH